MRRRRLWCEAASGLAAGYVAARWACEAYRRFEARRPAQGPAPDLEQSPDAEQSKDAVSKPPTPFAGVTECPAFPLAPAVAVLGARRVAVPGVVGAPAFLLRLLPSDLPPRTIPPRQPIAAADWQSVARDQDQRLAEPSLEVLQMQNQRTGGSQPGVPGPAPSLGGVGHWFVRHILRLADSLLALLLLPFLGRKLRWVTVAAAALTILLAFPYTHTALVTGASAAQRPFLERAAFNWQESFNSDLSTTWMDASALERTEAGTLRVQGLALNGKTMGLKEYAMDFVARADRRAIGWVVRAADPGNYYVFKLAPRGRAASGSDGVKFDLVRYEVIDGHAPAPDQRYTVHLVIHVKDNEFLNISTRVSEDQILTVINGFGVDEWKHPKMKTGGLGFLAENGESFQIKSLTISGNEDFLGLFLWGTEQALRSVRENVVSFMAGHHGPAAPVARQRG